MKHHFTTLKSKIIAIAFFSTIVPMTIVTLLATYQSSTSFRKTIGNELASKSLLIGDYIACLVNQKTIEIKMLSQADVMESDSAESIGQYLDEIRAENNTISSLLVLNDQNSPIAVSGFKASENSFKDHLPNLTKKFSDALADVTEKQGAVFVSEAFMYRNHSHIAMLTPITDDSNTIVIRTLLMLIDLTPISKIIKDFDDSIIGEKSVYILDNDGNIIASPDSNYSLFENFKDIDASQDLAKALDSDDGYFVYEDALKDPVIAGIADLAEFGITNALDWSIVAVAPLSDIEAPSREIRNMIILFAILSLVTSMLVSTFFVKGVNTKLKGVITSLKDTSFKVSDASGELANSSHHLASSCQETAAALQETVSSMSEISSMVGRTRDRSREAKDASMDIAQKVDDPCSKPSYFHDRQIHFED